MTIKVTKEMLRAHPNFVFVFGDNLLRKGKGGAAKLRDEPNTYGFVTKKCPSNNTNCFFTLEEYAIFFKEEFEKLIQEIRNNPTKLYLISKVGSGLANRYGIYEKIIQSALLSITEPNKIFV